MTHHSDLTALDSLSRPQPTIEQQRILTQADRTDEHSPVLYLPYEDAAHGCYCLTTSQLIEQLQPLQQLYWFNTAGQCFCYWLQVQPAQSPAISCNGQAK